MSRYAAAVVAIMGAWFAPTASAAAPVEIAITNVTVIDVVAGKAVPNQTVIVRGDRIAAVGPVADTPAKAGATIIDGTGKYLIPGLWDMHVHVAHDAMPSLFLRFGVTGVRHMLSPLKGFPKPDAADPLKGKEPAGPRVVAAVHFLDGAKSPFPNHALKVTTPAEARAAVRELKKQGASFVKIQSWVPKEAYLAAADEAKKLELPLVGHVPYGLTAVEVSEAKQLTIEHLGGVPELCASPKTAEKCRVLLGLFIAGTERDPHAPWKASLAALQDYDPKQADAAFQVFVKNGTWHAPTLVQVRAFAKLGEKEPLPPDVEKLLPLATKLYWNRNLDKNGGVKVPAIDLTLTKGELIDRQELFDRELKLVGEMHKAKVKLLAGTDTPVPLVVPGVALHDELELFVQAGLTPAEALRTATINAAECLKLADRHGSIALGNYADLVLLSKDPLADIRNTRTIEVVMIGGRIVPRK